jgi:hypothetical protein
MVDTVAAVRVKSISMVPAAASTTPIVAPIPPLRTMTGADMPGIGTGEYWITKSVIVGEFFPAMLKVTSVVTSVDPARLGVANAKLVKSPAAMHRKRDCFFIGAPGKWSYEAGTEIVPPNNIGGVDVRSDDSMLVNCSARSQKFACPRAPVPTIGHG